MSSKLIDRIWDHYPDGGGELLTMLALAEHADPDGSNCWPSIATVATMTRQAPRTVQYHVQHALSIGWLFLVEHGGGRNRPTKYRIPIDLIPQHVLGTTQKLHRLGEEPQTPQDLHGIDDEKGCNNPAITPQQLLHGNGAKPCNNPATAIAPDLDLKRSVPGPDSAAPNFDATPFISIPLINRDGEYVVCESQVLDWTESFPGVDVRNQLRRIREWNLSNASQRKTRKGIRGHITTWLGREQDKRPHAAPTVAKPIDTTCSEVEVGGERCGMPGERFGDRYLCSGHRAKRMERRPMPAGVRAALKHKHQVRT